MTKILIVDDNEQEVRRPLVRQLGRVFGAECILEAANGMEAVDMLADPGVDRVGVIVLDVMMPVMDGIAACRAIRADPACEGVYIAMLTGRDGGLPEGLEVGADVYLRKPCDADELIAVVRKGLWEFEQRQALTARLSRVEAEKEQLQRANVYVDLPFGLQEPVSWVDVVDTSR
ncbi:MAG: response regulator [Magnetococcales bacterium]|nr:response regulator [Magnetococcales bacterium]